MAELINILTPIAPSAVTIPARNICAAAAAARFAAAVQSARRPVSVDRTIKFHGQYHCQCCLRVVRSRVMTESTARPSAAAAPDYQVTIEMFVEHTPITIKKKSKHDCARPGGTEPQYFLAVNSQS